jgi:hypothetical protein
VWRAVAILPEHLLGEVSPEAMAEHPYGSQCPVGNGPFVFVSHTTQDRWVFEANHAFPKDLGGRPFLDRYVYRIIPDQTTLQTELLIQNVDAYVSVLPDQAQRIIDDPGVDLVAFQGLTYVFIAHDLALVEHVSDRVAVIYLGRIVEVGETADLYRNPQSIPTHVRCCLRCLEWIQTFGEMRNGSSCKETCPADAPARRMRFSHPVPAPRQGRVVRAVSTFFGDQGNTALRGVSEGVTGGPNSLDTP